VSRDSRYIHNDATDEWPIDWHKLTSHLSCRPVGHWHHCLHYNAVPALTTEQDLGVSGVVHCLFSTAYNLNTAVSDLVSDVCIVCILKQYSITQPEIEIVPKLVATIFWSRAQRHVTTSLMKLAVGERLI